jgi:hypothetical protein
MDTKDNDDVDASTWGEWAMIGYNNTKRRAVVSYSRRFEALDLDKRLHLMQAWIDKLCSEYDRMVDQPGESGNDDDET